MLTLTIVIPVYNEERHIKACLDAISRQTVLPDEVLVIDNNCTDKTIEIVKKYPFVKIIKEPKQGLIYARNTGFNHAKSDILGRIDADSVLDEDWVEIVKAYLIKNQTTKGVSGIAMTAILPYVSSIRSSFFSRSYYHFARAVLGINVLWGANTAIRAEIWDSIKDDVCLNDKLVHEDQDLSLCMTSKNMKIDILTNMKISTFGQTYSYLPKLIEYNNKILSTKKLHNRKGFYTNNNIEQTLLTKTKDYLFSFPAGAYIYLVALVTFPYEKLKQK